MKYFAILLLALSGCTTPQVIERTNTVTVKVPVLVNIPTPPTIVRPELMIYRLVDSDVAEPGKVVLYYKATIKQLQGYVIELETIIDGYRNASAAQGVAK